MIGVSLCPLCKHLSDDVVVNEEGFDASTCKAFPQGIPLAIFVGGFDHREPYPNDNDVRFALNTALATEADVASYEELRSLQSEFEESP